MIPLNQLIPECLLALGAAFMLGNLAAYIRLRPAWREARNARGGPAAKPGSKGTTKGDRSDSTVTERGRTDRSPSSSAATKPGQPGSAAKAAAGPRTGTSRRVTARVGEPTASRSQMNARVREPTASRSKLPSRTRVLANVLIGLLISVAALATLIRG